MCVYMKSWFCRARSLYSAYTILHVYMSLFLSIAVPVCYSSWSRQNFYYPKVYFSKATFSEADQQSSQTAFSVLLYPLILVWKLIYSLEQTSEIIF